MLCLPHLPDEIAGTLENWDPAVSSLSQRVVEPLVLLLQPLKIISKNLKRLRRYL